MNGGIIIESDIGLLTEQKGKELGFNSTTVGIAKIFATLYLERYKEREDAKIKASSEEIAAAAIYHSSIFRGVSGIDIFISQKNIAKFFNMTHYRFAKISDAMKQKLCSLSSEEIIAEVVRSGESPFLRTLQCVRGSTLGV